MAEKNEMERKAREEADKKLANACGLTQSTILQKKQFANEYEKQIDVINVISKIKKEQMKEMHTEFRKVVKKNELETSTCRKLNKRAAQREKFYSTLKVKMDHQAKKISTFEN